MTLCLDLWVELIAGGSIAGWAQNPGPVIKLPRCFTTIQDRQTVLACKIYQLLKTGQYDG